MNYTMITNEITDKDFKKFSDLIYRESGIHLKDEKKSLINSRLGKVLRQRNLNSYTDYYNLIVNDNTGNEIIQLLDLVSTNKTFFFREYNHFEYLNSKIIPDITRNNEKSHQIDIWSAGCSSGEEAYSLAITLKEFFKTSMDWFIKITATDISTIVLSKAQNGIYHQSEFENVSDHLIKKYFQYGVEHWDGYLRVKKELKSIIQFQRFNLLDKFNSLRKFDVIFCRNVLIYFDKDTQQSIISKFAEQLNPKGYLIVGHSESLFNIKHNLIYIKPTIYQKN